MNRRYGGDGRYRQDVDDVILHRILAENGITKPDMNGRSVTQVFSSGGCGCKDRGRMYPDNNNSMVPGGNCEGCRYGESKTWGVKDHPLAIVYSPIQEWCELYDIEMGLTRGTIFKQLDLPLEAENRKGGNCCG